MAAVQAPGLLTLALNDGLPPGVGPPFGRLLVLSLALHCGFLVLVGNIPVSDTGPAPLVFQEVSLVTLSEPNRAANRSSDRLAKAEPARSLITDEPAPQPATLAPAPSLPIEVSRPSVPALEDPVASAEPQAAAPASQPRLIPMLPGPGSSVAEDRARSEALVREALSGIRLPPEYPAESRPSQAPGSSGTHQTPVTDQAEPIPLPTTAPSYLADLADRTGGANARSEALLREALEKIHLPSEGSRPPEAQAATADPQSEDVMRDALSKIELPPETPRFERLASLPTVTPTPTVPAREVPSPVSPARRPPAKEVQRQVDTILGKLKLPELPPGPPPPQNKLGTFDQKRPPRSSLAEDIGKQLRAIEDRRQKKDRSPPEGTNAGDSRLARKTEPGGNQARLENPAMSIQAPGAPSGSSRYWALVQHKISSYWVALGVEPTARSLVVMVKFRLHRSGKVSDVVVEEPSGNHYYDLAAKRAVVRAEPLPAFPSSIVKPYIDTHITFEVGEQSG